MCGCMGIGRSGQRTKVTSGGSGTSLAWVGIGGVEGGVIARREERREQPKDKLQYRQMKH